MDSQSKIRYLKIGIGVFEKEIEFARRKTKIFKEIYLTADKKFKQYLKGLSLDPSVTPGQDTGECSDGFTSQNHFLLAEMKKLLAKRIHLLAEVANLVAEGEKETISYLQINIQFLQMLIECEKYKTAEFKKRYIGMAEECKEVLYKLNDHLDEFTVEIIFKFDPQLAQRETLLTRREKQPSCPVKDCEQRKSSATESQKTIDQLQSKLAMLEIILEYEKRDTEKYKQLFLKVVDKYEEMFNRIKQRPSSCRCDPNIRPVQHRHECNIAFTRDDEELLTDMEVFRIEMRTCVVLIEEAAGHEIAAITEKVRQEVARSIKHSDCTALCLPSCSGPHGKKRPSNAIGSDDRVNYLQSKLNMVKVQLIYENAFIEKFGQLSLTVGVKFEELLNEVKRRSFYNNFASGQDTGECSRNFTDENHHLLTDTEYQILEREKQILEMTTKLAEIMMGHSLAVTDVRQERGETKEVEQQTTAENQPLLAQTENQSKEKNTPADSENVTEGSVTSDESAEEVDIYEDAGENTPETCAADSPQQEPESPSGSLVKAACFGVAAVAGVGVLAVGLRYFR
ncbi:hypothetical protein EXN66_Car021933 [Channa argus]|uniref:Uncharacterized protein n=1 Tax=Channa argus TaxID=215402 RepID=A0A6G1QU64_CHAAH|nr:hypothetical protein EXN66_Car021933 [Channa argus]